MNNNKPEPLKDKSIQYSVLIKSKNHEEVLRMLNDKEDKLYFNLTFKKEDVKGAVEWLKDEINKKEFYDWSCNDNMIDYIDMNESNKSLFLLIKKAFPDLYKKEQNKPEQ